ncbi:MAG: hypothetical protein ACKOAK_10520 [Ignavibacteria bacterium]
MNILLNIVLIIVVLCGSHVSSIAQDANFQLYNPIHIGFGVSGGLGLHSTNSTLRCIGDPACPTYEGGTGGMVGIMGNIEWMPNNWGMRGSVGFMQSSVSMTTIDDRAFVKDGNGVIVPLIREHALNIAMPMMTMDLGLQASFGKSRVFFGPSIGLLLNPSWQSTSTLLSPNTVTFSSGSRDTIFLDQEIPNVNALQFGFGTGFGHHIPISKKIVLIPEISASIPFSTIIAGPAWKQTAILFGMSIRWGMGAVKEEVIRRAEVIDTVEVNVDERIGSLFIEGQRKSTRTIEEFETYRMITETTVRTDTLKIGLPPKQSPKPIFTVHIAQDVSSEEVQHIMVRGQLVT